MASCPTRKLGLLSMRRFWPTRGAAAPMATGTNLRQTLSSRRRFLAQRTRKWKVGWSPRAPAARRMPNRRLLQSAPIWHARKVPIPIELGMIQLKIAAKAGSLLCSHLYGCIEVDFALCTARCHHSMPRFRRLETISTQPS
jgi:hypothetical protein